MNPGRFCRRAVALAAAYALALQVLLLAFVPLGPASLAALCTHVQAADGAKGGAGTGGSHPAGDDTPCAALCAALAQGIAAPVPQVDAVASAPVAFTVVAPVVRGWASPRIAFRQPQSPRAPPAA